MKRRNILISILIIIIAIIGYMVWPEKELKGNFLSSEFNSIEDYLTSSSELNLEVSEAPVGWHLDHVLLVINGIYQQLDTSDTSQYKSEFNFTRTLVFATDNIPRGRGQSPERVRPKNNVSREEILKHLSISKEQILLFDSLPENAFFKHPYFGLLNRKQSKEFLKIHTQHHLDIVKDILNSK